MEHSPTCFSRGFANADDDTVVVVSPEQTPHVEETKAINRNATIEIDLKTPVEEQRNRVFDLVDGDSELWSAHSAKRNSYNPSLFADSSKSSASSCIYLNSASSSNGWTKESPITSDLTTDLTNSEDDEPEIVQVKHPKRKRAVHHSVSTVSPTYQYQNPYGSTSRNVMLSSSTRSPYGSLGCFGISDWNGLSSSSSAYSSTSAAGIKRSRFRGTWPSPIDRITPYPSSREQHHYGHYMNRAAYHQPRMDGFGSSNGYAADLETSSSRYAARSSLVQPMRRSHSPRRRMPASLRGKKKAKLRALLSSGREFNAEDYETLLQLDETNTKNGLTLAEIERACAVTYLKKVDGNSECSICLSPFTKKQKIAILRNCTHKFHHRCSSRWLKQKNSCPICQRKALEK